MHRDKEYKKFQKHLIQSSIVILFLTLSLYVHSLGLTNPVDKNVQKSYSKLASVIEIVS